MFTLWNIIIGYVTLEVSILWEKNYKYLSSIFSLTIILISKVPTIVKK